MCFHEPTVQAAVALAGRCRQRRRGDGPGEARVRAGVGDVHQDARPGARRKPPLVLQLDEDVRGALGQGGGHEADVHKVKVLHHDVQEERRVQRLDDAVPVRVEKRRVRGGQAARCRALGDLLLDQAAERRLEVGVLGGHVLIDPDGVLEAEAPVTVGVAFHGRVGGASHARRGRRAELGDHPALPLVNAGSRTAALTPSAAEDFDGDAPGNKRRVLGSDQLRVATGRVEQLHHHPGQCRGARRDALKRQLQDGHAAALDAAFLDHRDQVQHIARVTNADFEVDRAFPGHGVGNFFDHRLHKLWVEYHAKAECSEIPVARVHTHLRHHNAPRALLVSVGYTRKE